ncbi:Ger(x)C family spore germination protein [Paenibacillus massiliensis]|uniref:Ger(x)C family spore germination protein n=1 Tax=Paenibacillus massiliensis TaxID=225917 RepID=UPI0003769326|nr:Ger(x)C family spore germination protein [Paenibacillus massiliensis]
MHKISKLCVSVILIFILPGCWNRTELNEIGITSATGFDREGNDWLATYQVIVPSSITSNTGGGSGSSQPAVNVFSVKGSTITEAASLSNLDNPRRLYFAHNNVVIVGKEAMEKGIAQLIDNYMRNTESRETVWLLLTDKKADSILRKLIPPEKIPGSSLAQILIKEKRIASIFPPVTVFDYAYKMNSDAKAIGIPMVTISGTESENEKKLESLDIYKEVTPSQRVRISELAIIQNDRLVGYMNQNESRGLSWLTNKVNGTVLTLSSSKEKPRQDISLTVLNSKTRLQLIKKGYSYIMNVQVKTKANISESGSKLNLSQVTVVKQIEAQAAKKIGDEIRASWEVMQQLGTDLGGFADIIHREHPKHWKEIENDWGKEFKNMDLNVQVNVTIKRPGMFQNSFRSLE